MSAEVLGFVVVSYLLGSIPFGLVVAQLWVGRDVRSEGSGNIGATNVARVAGGRVGLLVLLLDAAKGALPTLVAIEQLPAMPRAHAAIGLAAVLGHVFPVWLRFRGGKGVATSLGVLTALLPVAATVGAGLYILVFLLFRVSSVSSLIGAVGAAGSTWLLRAEPAYGALAAVLLGLLLFTHRANLARLARREEPRL